MKVKRLVDATLFQKMAYFVKYNTLTTREDIQEMYFFVKIDYLYNTIKIATEYRGNEIIELDSYYSDDDHANITDLFQRVITKIEGIDNGDF